MDIRQTRRGWCQEIMGCEAKTEFKVFIDGTQVAHALEDAGCCCRCWCNPCHPFTMEVKELNTDAELLTVHRPCACCAGSCKCCCFQRASVTSGGQAMGSVKEQCYCCVPRFTLYDGKGNPIYKMHQPTCCCGCCVNPCTEGNPCCGVGCCKEPFHIYPADQKSTDGDAPYSGKIVKKAKSGATEVFTDADAFEVDFPSDATTDQKALLIGTSIFLNAIFFEEADSGGGITSSIADSTAM